MEIFEKKETNKKEKKIQNKIKATFTFKGH